MNSVFRYLELRGALPPQLRCCRVQSLSNYGYVVNRGVPDCLSVRPAVHPHVVSLMRRLSPSGVRRRVLSQDLHLAVPESVLPLGLL